MPPIGSERSDARWPAGELIPGNDHDLQTWDAPKVFVGSDDRQLSFQRCRGDERVDVADQGVIGPELAELGVQQVGSGAAPKGSACRGDIAS
jgi:hypothetical protein